jgi:hypothetical protein
MGFIECKGLLQFIFFPHNTCASQEKTKKNKVFQKWNADSIFWKLLANNRGKKYVGLGAL